MEWRGRLKTCRLAIDGRLLVLGDVKVSGSTAGSEFLEEEELALGGRVRGSDCPSGGGPFPGSMPAAVP